MHSDEMAETCESCSRKRSTPTIPLLPEAVEASSSRAEVEPATEVRTRERRTPFRYPSGLPTRRWLRPTALLLTLLVPVLASQVEPHDDQTDARRELPVVSGKSTTETIAPQGAASSDTTPTAYTLVGATEDTLRWLIFKDISAAAPIRVQADGIECFVQAHPSANLWLRFASNGVDQGGWYGVVSSIGSVGSSIDSSSARPWAEDGRTCFDALLSETSHQLDSVSARYEATRSQPLSDRRYSLFTVAGPLLLGRDRFDSANVSFIEGRLSQARLFRSLPDTNVSLTVLLEPSSADSFEIYLTDSELFVDQQASRIRSLYREGFSWRIDSIRDGVLASRSTNLVPATSSLAELRKTLRAISIRVQSALQDSATNYNRD